MEPVLNKNRNARSKDDLLQHSRHISRSVSLYKSLSRSHSGKDFKNRVSFDKSPSGTKIMVKIGNQSSVSSRKPGNEERRIIKVGSIEKIDNAEFIDPLDPLDPDATLDADDENLKHRDNIRPFNLDLEKPMKAKKTASRKKSPSKQ